MSNSKCQLTIIGGGQMASALIAGLQAKKNAGFAIHVIEKNAEQAARLKTRFAISVSIEIEKITDADIVLLAVKPQQAKDVITQLPNDCTKPLWVSIMAGVRCAQIENWLDPKKNKNLKIIRTMPNTPAQIGQGVTGLYANLEVSETQKQIVSELMSTMGHCYWLTEESMLDAVTAITGSGPAYFFYWMEAMLNAAVQMGLPKTLATEMIYNTCKGASMLALQSTDALDDLRQKVTSKGGTTEAALQTMKGLHVDQAIQQAIEAAYIRSQELSRG